MKNKVLFMVFLVVALVLMPGLSTAKTVQLRDFGQLLNALKDGDTVKAVFFYKLCKLISENKTMETAPDAIGGMEVKTWEYFAKGSVRNEKAFISASQTVLINHPRYGFVNNYVKVRVYDDNKVEILAMYLAPVTLEIRMEETFHTEIHNGENNAGARFFGSGPMKENEEIKGIVFFKTKMMDVLKAFYIEEIGCGVWLEQGGCVILKAGNMLFGFCQSDKADMDALITFFFDSKETVDRMYGRFKNSALEGPKENPKYRIYHFFAKDPEGRMIEFQHFLHPVKEI